MNCTSRPYNKVYAGDDIDRDHISIGLQTSQRDLRGSIGNTKSTSYITNNHLSERCLTVNYSESGQPWPEWLKGPGANATGKLNPSGMRDDKCADRSSTISVTGSIQRPYQVTLPRVRYGSLYLAVRVTIDLSPLFLFSAQQGKLE